MFILAPKHLSVIFGKLKFPSEIFGGEHNDKQSAILVNGDFPNICAYTIVEQIILVAIRVCV